MSVRRLCEALGQSCDGGRNKIVTGVNAAREGGSAAAVRPTGAAAKSQPSGADSKFWLFVAKILKNAEMR